MATRIHFTKAAIERLPIPTDRDRELYKDDEITSLEVAVFKSGKKTFYVYKRIGSKPSRIKLGAFPDTTVDNARRLAQTKLGEIAQGIDPNDTKRQLRQQITFGQLFDIFMEKHSKIHKKSFKNDVSMYNCHLKAKFGNTKISEITSEKIRNFHLRLGERAKPAANRVLDLVSSMFEQARQMDLFEGENPVKRVKKFEVSSRDRYLLPDEMPEFFKALANEPNEIARDYIFMSLFTGARKSNVLSMSWDEINLDAKQPYWRIPDVKSKSGDTMQIPLSETVLKLLKHRKKHNPKDCAFVFPGVGKAGHLADPKKAWKRVLEKAGLSNLRLHDLRRTLGSWLGRSGASSYIISKALGHGSIRSTEPYTRLSIDPVASSIDEVTKAMVQAAGQK